MNPVHFRTQLFLIKMTETGKNGWPKILSVRNIPYVKIKRSSKQIIGVGGQICLGLSLKNFCNCGRTKKENRVGNEIRTVSKQIISFSVTSI